MAETREEAVDTIKEIANAIDEVRDVLRRADIKDPGTAELVRKSVNTLGKCTETMRVDHLLATLSTPRESEVVAWLALSAGGGVEWSTAFVERSDAENHAADPVNRVREIVPLYAGSPPTDEDGPEGEGRQALEEAENELTADRDFERRGSGYRNGVRSALAVVRARLLGEEGGG